MLRRKMIPLIVAGVVVMSGASAAFAAREHNDEQQEAAAVQSAAISLAQAVDTAEKHSGGQAIAAGMEKTKGGYRYEVKTVAKNHVTESMIDSSSGKVIATENKGPVKRLLNREHQAEVAKLQSAKTTLSAAISAVEQQSGGKAFEAAFEHEKGKPGFEVDVSKDGVMQKFMVEAATGKIVSLAAAEYGQNREGHED